MVCYSKFEGHVACDERLFCESRFVLAKTESIELVRHWGEYKYWTWTWFVLSSQYFVPLTIFCPTHPTNKFFIHSTPWAHPLPSGMFSPSPPLCIDSYPLLQTFQPYHRHPQDCWWQGKVSSFPSDCFNIFYWFYLFRSQVEVVLPQPSGKSKGRKAAASQNAAALEEEDAAFKEVYPL